MEWCQHNAALTRPFLWRVGCERARGVMQDVSRGHRLAKREVASMALLELPCPGRLDTEHRQNVTFCQRLGGFDEASWCASRRRMWSGASTTQRWRGHSCGVLGARGVLCLVCFDGASWRASRMGADERAHEARWREGFGLERQRSVSRPRAASSSVV